MAPAAKFVSILVLVLSLVCQPIHAMSTKADFLHCRSIVQSWAESSLNEEVKVDKHTLQDLLFFLHIPRTGGRTYFYCFLRKLYTTYLECPRSYDKLRFDPSKPDCRLMVTHDDYSIMSKLPRERTSVVTILRNPVDRVFSTYEFSVEVAARFLVHPNLTSLMEMDRRIRAKTKGVSTLDIWPWKHLVPWMRDDLFARRDARKHGDFTGIRERNDPYNMEEVLMPLHDFINDDVAHDIIHNGATFQIAGLTNNSYLKEAHEVRRCVRNYHDLGEYVLNVAKRRLENMLYVGLTEEHKESATMFANVVGVQVISQLQMLSSSFEQTSDNKTELSSPFPDSAKVRKFGTKNQQASQISSPKNDGTSNERLTVEELMEAYESCIPNLRKTQERRRVSSLQRISPANFTKKGRLQVPDDVLQKIISLNSLDVELYKHAQGIFKQQKNRLIQKSSVKVELQEKRTENFYEFLPRLTDSLLTITFLLLLVFILLLLNSRTRLKMKLRKWFCSPH